MSYAGFWPRAGALLLDVLLWAPLVAVHLTILRGYSISALLVCSLTLGIFGLAYPIYFHARWGQTVGKMITKIRVTHLDGTPIGPKQAILRSSVDLLLWVLYTPLMLYVLLTSSESAWSSLSAIDRGRLLAERNPLSGIYEVCEQLWLWSELVVLLFNKRRRALHDFIAGTVVIKTGPQP